jgi:predicted amidophosphoribosyltransferase
MIEITCKICNKDFKKNSYNKHIKGTTLCLKDVNCKDMYLELKELNEKYRILEESNNELKDTITELREDNKILSSNKELLGEQMKDVIKTKGIINNNGNTIQYITVSNPVPFSQTDWGLEQIDFNFVKAGAKALAQLIKDKTKIHEDEDGTCIRSYYNSDATRESFSKLNDRLEYEKDSGGNQFREKVLEEIYYPRYEQVLTNKYPGYPNDITKMMKLPAIQQEEACNAIELVKNKLFKQGSNENKELIKILKGCLYMSGEAKQRVKFTEVI